jgi:hypothetical protein
MEWRCSKFETVFCMEDFSSEILLVFESWAPCVGFLKIAMYSVSSHFSTTEEFHPEEFLLIDVKRCGLSPCCSQQSFLMGLVVV